MKNIASYTDWNPSKGDYVKSALIEQRNLKKKNRRKITYISGAFLGIILIIALIITLSKHTVFFG
ncbi:MAG: hypothetical protein ACM3Q2_12350 [Syntrophothermus sp.]